MIMKHPPNMLLYFYSLLSEKIGSIKTDRTKNMLFVPLQTSYFRIKIHSS
jgi:hypothetical protein